MKAKLVLVILVFAMFFVGCKKEEKGSGNSRINNFINHGCNYEKRKMSNETIRLKMRGTELQVEYRGVHLPCESDLLIEARQVGGTLVFEETGLNYLVNCICPYDLDYFCNDLSYGNYTIKFKRMGTEYLSLKLNITPSMDTTIVLN